MSSPLNTSSTPWGRFIKETMGKSCFPKDRAMDIAVRTLLAWVEENLDYPVDIILCCMDSRIYQHAQGYLQAYGKKRAVKSD